MNNDKPIFQCQECGLHYRSENMAKKCQAFCKANQACSMEIAKKAVEYELQEKEISDES